MRLSYPRVACVLVVLVSAESDVGLQDLQLLGFCRHWAVHNKTERFR